MTTPQLCYWASKPLGQGFDPCDDWPVFVWSDQLCTMREVWRIDPNTFASNPLCISWKWFPLEYAWQVRFAVAL